MLGRGREQVVLQYIEAVWMAVASSPCKDMHKTATLMHECALSELNTPQKLTQTAIKFLPMPCQTICLGQAIGVDVFQQHAKLVGTEHKNLPAPI